VGTLTEKINYHGDSFITLNIPDDGAVGLFISGGADSAMLCYLLADTIVKKKLKTRVYPITAEMLKRPYCVTYATNVLEFVSGKTGFKFERHLCFPVPNHNKNLSERERDGVYSYYADEFVQRYDLQCIFHGVTANPPLEALPDTTMARRPQSRDSLEWRRDQEQKKDLHSPFLHVDKRVVATLYKKFGLLNTLFPLTRSCEAEMEETAYFTKDCFEVRPGKECWWCRERAFGFADFLPEIRKQKNNPRNPDTALLNEQSEEYIFREKIYYSDTGFVTLEIPRKGTIGCFLSGGIDSALLCYLVAKAICVHGLKTRIFPITTENLLKPYNLKHASNILRFITEDTGFQFGHHLTYAMPNHEEDLSDQEAMQIDSYYIDEFMVRYGLSYIFNANVGNPHSEDLPDIGNSRRPQNRDDAAWVQRQENNPDFRSPFLHITKTEIAAIYASQGLLETLFPLTRSCEASAKETEFFAKDCFFTRDFDEFCWACRERNYAFREYF